MNRELLTSVLLKNEKSRTRERVRPKEVFHGDVSLSQGSIPVLLHAAFPGLPR